MGISDIITLVSLVIALVAILSEKNRKHLLLKFHWVDYILLTVAFILINYFTFYEAFYRRGIYIPELYFNDSGFGQPKNWSYIITLAALGYLFYKIWYSFYPASQLPKVIKYYQRQIETEEISFLFDTLERYHSKHIKRMIKEGKEDNEEESWIERRLKRKTFEEKVSDWLMDFTAYVFPQSWYNKSHYATAVLHNVIATPGFIVLGANLRPYFFPDLFASFTKSKRRYFPDDIVNQYFEQLLQQKNFWLRKELKISTDNDPTQPEWFYTENRILGSLFKDISVAEVNEVWRSFGEAALAELQEERLKGYNSSMFHECTDDGLLWNYRTHWVIQFFYALINEAIVKKYTESHFFLFYYDHIADEIMDTFKQYPPKREDTIYHKLLDEVLNNSIHWLNTSHKKDHPSIYHNILDCIGLLADHITASNEVPKRTKTSYIQWLMSSSCTIQGNEHADDLREKLARILTRPTMTTNGNHPYYGILEEAWIGFDKIPYQTVYGDIAGLARLKLRVISPLGMDPHQH